MAQGRVAIPERTAEGQRARYIDPETGRRRPIRTYHRTTAEYLELAAAASLTPLGEQTLAIPSGPGRVAPPGAPRRRAGARVGGLLEAVGVGARVSLLG